MGLLGCFAWPGFCRSLLAATVIDTYASASLTQIEIDKITDGTGKAFQRDKSGNFATPAPIAGAVRTATYSGIVGTI